MIIDCHVHLFSGERELDDLMAAREKAGIDRICVSSCAENFNQPKDDAIRRAFELYPDHVHGMGYVRLGVDGPDAVDRFVDQGFSGIKVINPLVLYDDDSLMPIYERIERRGVPILFHTGIVARFPLDGAYGFFKGFYFLCIFGYDLLLSHNSLSQRIYLLHSGSSIYFNFYYRNLFVKISHI